jgi:polyisoprenoid-binding protein YceI
MPAPQLGRYGIDPAHSAVTFRTRHLFGLAPVRGSSAVRSARFLDTGTHPVITFTAGRLDGQSLTGTLTVRGVSRPVTLTVERVEAAAGWFAARATTRIDRTEFGVTAQRGMAGRYLDLTVEARCVRS